jgi:uncharacterized LabA/DUF88 family protein
MTFVDGENFAMRAKPLANKVSMTAGPHYREDTFLWFPPRKAKNGLQTVLPGNIELNSYRSYYYASVPGGSERVLEVRRELSNLGFNAKAFHKDKGKRGSKGVDISLATDMLSHAAHGHYDAAVLIAGDGDYVPLVNEVKRCGRLVIVAFLESVDGLSEELKFAADTFIALDALLEQAWAGKLPQPLG